MSAGTQTAHTLALRGLDGQNPLAFLATLGTLRTLARAWHDHVVLVSWAICDGMWAPILHSDQPLTEDRLSDVLMSELQSDAAQHPISFMKKKESVYSQPVPDLFRTRADEARSVTDRDALDWLSAMSSDLVPEATSQLQTARRDYFWGNLESVMRLTTIQHLQRTLFHPWDYADPLENQSLHIEPSEDRRHAHQWSQPSGDPDRKRRGGMLGANRLAIEAFPLFQSTTVGDKLATRGFTGVRADDTQWTWPLWAKPASLEVLASLLALSELQSDSPDLRSLSSRGIRAVFRCRRIVVGKTPNFTPAVAV